MSRLAIVQPYVPRYRVGFFQGLAESLRNDGIELSVIAGQPAKEQGARGDAAGGDWLITVPSRELRIGARRIVLTNSRRWWKGADGIIVPHQGSSLDALSALSMHKSLRVGVWGHIAPYTSPLNRIDGAIERWQLRRAGHVFAYTAGGASFARGHGVPEERLTTVMNTIDSSALESEMAGLTPHILSRFAREQNIPNGNYLAYIGGIDRSKRIELLVDALDLLKARDSSVHVVVAGDGAQLSLLDNALARGQVSLIGYADDRVKARLLAGAIAIVNPGRVGLVAVDALASQRPIITTRWPWHAPEIDYLTRGESVFFTEDSAAALADALESAVEGKLATTAPWPAPPRLSSMIANFHSGVVSLLQD